MPAKYEVGSTVYFLESNQKVIEGTIIRYGSGFYTIRFIHYGEPAVIRIKEHRLFSTEKEASEKLLSIRKKKGTLTSRPYPRSPHLM